MIFLQISLFAFSSACARPLKMRGEVGFDAAPHLLAQNMAGTRLDVAGELVFSPLRLKGAANGFHAGLHLLDGAATVLSSEVEVQRAGAIIPAMLGMSPYLRQPGM